jgi:hypothetical protein
MHRFRGTVKPGERQVADSFVQILFQFLFGEAKIFTNGFYWPNERAYDFGV